MVSTLIWPGVVLIIIIALAVIGVPKIIKQRKEIRKTGKYPEGYLRNQSMGIWMAVGVAMGIAMDALPIGIAVGLALGVAIGTSREERAKKEGKIRKLTKNEKKEKEKIIWGLLIAGLLALVIGVVVYFLVK